MSETLNTLYRLFAPLIVVVVIIAGVNLSSSLIKNAKERQTAISIAYAQACPVGTSPAVPNQSPPDPKNPGQYIPTPCAAATPGGPVPGMSDPATGCCKGSANQKSAKDAAKGGAGGAMKGMTDLLKSLASMLKPKEKQPKPPEPPKTPDNRPPKPVCKSLSVSPTIPLRPGESATLTWVLDGGMPDAVIVTPGVGAVSGFSVKVKPRSSTTYTVTARNARGSSTCPKVRVYVGPDDGSDDDAFNDFNDEYSSADVSNKDIDIWDNGYGKQKKVHSPVSSYDNIDKQNNISKQDSVSEDEDYYNFLDTLGDEFDDTQSTDAEEDDVFSDYTDDDSIKDYAEYYFGDDTQPTESNDLGILSDITPSWYDFEDSAEESINVNDGADSISDNNSYSDDVYFDDDWIPGSDNTEQDEYSNDDLYAGNELTNEDIYGVWQRPQKATISGFGFRGGTTAPSSLNIEQQQEESVGIFTRISRWFKKVFCFWCNGE